MKDQWVKAYDQLGAPKTKSARAVYTALVYASDEYAKAVVSRQTLVKATGMCERSVVNGINALKKAHILAVDYNRGLQTKTGMTNIYYLLPFRPIDTQINNPVHINQYSSPEDVEVFRRCQQKRLKKKAGELMQSAIKYAFRNTNFDTIEPYDEKFESHRGEMALVENARNYTPEPVLHPYVNHIEPSREVFSSVSREHINKQLVCWAQNEIESSQGSSVSLHRELIYSRGSFWLMEVKAVKVRVKAANRHLSEREIWLYQELAASGAAEVEFYDDDEVNASEPPPPPPPKRPVGKPSAPFAVDPKINKADKASELKTKLSELGGAAGILAQVAMRAGQKEVPAEQVDLTMQEIKSKYGDVHPSLQDIYTMDTKAFTSFVLEVVVPRVLKNGKRPTFKNLVDEAKYSVLVGEYARITRVDVPTPTKAGKIAPRPLSEDQRAKQVEIWKREGKNERGDEYPILPGDKAIIEAYRRTGEIEPVLAYFAEDTRSSIMRWFTGKTREQQIEQAIWIIESMEDLVKSWENNRLLYGNYLQ